MLWCQVRLSRDGREGTLDVDNGFEMVPLSSSGQSRTVEVNSPYYVGGMPKDVANNAAHNLNVSLQSDLLTLITLTLTSTLTAHVSLLAVCFTPDC